MSLIRKSSVTPMFGHGVKLIYVQSWHESNCDCLNWKSHAYIFVSNFQIGKALAVISDAHRYAPPPTPHSQQPNQPTDHDGRTQSSLFIEAFRSLRWWFRSNPAPVGPLRCADSVQGIPIDTRLDMRSFSRTAPRVTLSYTPATPFPATHSLECAHHSLARSSFLSTSASWF
jgi:hypothetical protein